MPGSLVFRPYALFLALVGCLVVRPVVAADAASLLPDIFPQGGGGVDVVTAAVCGPLLLPLVEITMLGVASLCSHPL